MFWWHVYVLKLFSKYDMEKSKIKKGKSKTSYFFFFILSLSKWKGFYNFGPQTTELIRKYHSSIKLLEKISDKDSFTESFN